MTELSLTCTLQRVGPRRAGDPVYFALQVAAGTTDEPADPNERRRWLDACLPQQLFRARDEIEVLVYRGVPSDMGSAGTVVARRAHVGTGMPMNPDLPLAVAHQVQEMDSDRVRMQWPIAEGAEAEDRWIVHVHTFATLPPALNAAVGACWYFELPADLVREGASYAAVPMMLNRAVDGRALHLADRRLDRLRYDDGASVPGARAQAALLALNVAAAEPLDRLWLAVSDARDDHQSDLQQRLLDALDPNTLLRSVDSQRLAAQLEPSLGLAAGHSLAELGAAALAWMQSRAQASERWPDDEAGRLAWVATRRARVAALWQRAMANRPPGAPLLDAVREELTSTLTQQWSSTLNAEALRTHLHGLGLLTAELRWKADAPAALLGDWVQQWLTAAPRPPAPQQPGEGLDFLVGEPDQRVRHQSQADALDEIAEIGVLVRRYDGNDPAGRPWRLVTGGLPLLSENQVLSPPQPRGLVAAYEEGVLHSDYCYRGMPMLGASPLERVHRQSAHEGDADDGLRLAQLSYAAPTLRRQDVLDMGDDPQRYAAPPLRYGDHYQIAAFVIDRAGGLPSELSGAVPWQYAAAGLDTVSPPHSADIPFKRRVPVGEINITPVAPDAWPSLPDDVVLRGREYLSAKDRNGGQLPVVLLRKGSGIRPSAELGEYRFQFEPPQIDEHTLMRWAMPAIGAADAAEQQLRLRDALIRIYADRDRVMADGPSTVELPHDPAVTAIGLRVQMFDERDHEQRYELVLPLQPATEPFRQRSMTLTLEIGAPLVEAARVRVPAGGFAVVELLPLLALDVYQQRMDNDALAELVEDQAFQTNWIAFRASTLLVEAASAALPTAEQAYRALDFARNANGAVELRLNTAQMADTLRFLDRYQIAAQRWVWRNHPLVPDMQTLANLSPDERVRRLSGGLPEALANPDADVRNGPASRQFDQIAAVDRGLVDRAGRAGRVPRVPIPQPLPDHLLLETDTRDEVTHADYLRYRLTLRSRYAGVLDVPERVGTPAQADLDAWQRVSTGYYGGAPKPPKVLALLPLTHQLKHDPQADRAERQSTPFLMLLDEVWYREYGQGDQLIVTIDRATREIGDDADALLPLEAGPLADHYLRSAGELTGAPDAYFRWQPCEVFGPFGHTLDRSGNEALANATAFVVYLPAAMGPHWSARLRIQRAVAPVVSRIPGPDSPQIPPSEAVVRRVYSIPDSGSLIPRRAGVTVPLRLSAANAGGNPVWIPDVQPPMQPHFCAGMDAAQRAELVSGYRYLLLLGPMLNDGGRGVDLFVPSQVLVWNDANERWHALGRTPARDHTHGRIIEVMLNGRRAFGSYASIDQATSLQALMRALFETQAAQRDQVKDGAGTIRRISDVFDVEFVR